VAHAGRQVPGGFDGTLPNGKSFGTPAELRKLLLDETPEFNRCLTEKMLTYALGRDSIARYSRTVTDISRKVTASGYRARVLIDQIVHSYPFQNGRRETDDAAKNPVVSKAAVKPPASKACKDRSDQGRAVNNADEKISLPANDSAWNRNGQCRCPSSMQ